MPKAKLDTTLLDEFQTKLTQLLVEFADKIFDVIQRNPDIDAQSVRALVTAEIRKRFGGTAAAAD